MHVGLGRLLSFSSAQEALSTGLVQLTLYAFGCLPSCPCRHRVKPANSVPGGEARLVIGSRKKRIGTRKKCIVLLQTLLQGEFKSPAEAAGGTQSTPVLLQAYPQVSWGGYWGNVCGPHFQPPTV